MKLNQMLNSNSMTISFTIFSFHRFTIFFLLIILISSCRNGRMDEQFQSLEKGLQSPAGLVVEYPLNGTVFPPEFPAPLFSWTDTANLPAKWHIRIYAQSGTEIYREKTKIAEWRPDPAIWQRIKAVSGTDPVSFDILGIGNGLHKRRMTSARITFSFSQDSVGASVF